METAMKPPEPFDWLLVDPDVLAILASEAEDHPRWADVLNRYGISLLATGKTEDAAAVFERALAINPRYAWACLNHLQAVALQGDHARARALLETAPDPDPGAKAYVAAVLSLLAGGDGSEALDALPRELADRPDFLRLRAALVAGRDPEAARSLREAVVRGHTELGSTAMLPRPEDAGDPRHRLSFVPGLHQLFLQASALEARLGRWEDAERSAQAAAVYWFDRGGVRHQQGFAASLRGEDDRAVRLWRAAAEESPSDPRAPIALAYHWSAAGQLEDARGSMRDALDRAPGYADLHHQMGLLEAAEGNLEAALASFRRALDLNPNYAVARLQAAVTLFELERWIEAREAFTVVVDAGLDSSDIELRIGRIEEVLGNHDRAGRAYREAIRLNPTDPLPHYHLGRLHRLQGNRSGAKKAWRRFLELDGDSARRDEVRSGLDEMDEPSGGRP
jgi:tetratricopeptide (TPR) repeat protein